MTQDATSRELLEEVRSVLLQQAESLTDVQRAIARARRFLSDKAPALAEAHAHLAATQPSPVQGEVQEALSGAVERADWVEGEQPESAPLPELPGEVREAICYLEIACATWREGKAPATGPIEHRVRRLIEAVQALCAESAQLRKDMGEAVWRTLPGVDGDPPGGTWQAAFADADMARMAAEDERDAALARVKELEGYLDDEQRLKNAVEADLNAEYLPETIVPTPPTEARSGWCAGKGWRLIAEGERPPAIGKVDCPPGGCGNPDCANRKEAQAEQRQECDGSGILIYCAWHRDNPPSSSAQDCACLPCNSHLSPPGCRKCRPCKEPGCEGGMKTGHLPMADGKFTKSTLTAPCPRCSGSGIEPAPQPQSEQEG